MEELRYYRDGKIFVLQARANRSDRRELSPKPPVEHFWLCGHCSQIMTITFEPSGCAKTIPKHKTRHPLSA
ncbi:MAG: hypothetical protein NVS9B15_08810 [Acidobacteriaceae bacterium]